MRIDEKKLQELLIDDIIIKLSGKTAPRGDDEICISVLEAKTFLMQNLDVFKFISLQSSSSKEPTSIDTAPVDKLIDEIMEDVNKGRYIEGWSRGKIQEILEKHLTSKSVGGEKEVDNQTQGMINLNIEGLDNLD